jgi:uncharacterized protein involved in exopolysaccharide biosynthesis
MGEPRLEDISDYNTLKGEKKKVVLAVILAGLIMGVIYAVTSNRYDAAEDSIVVEETSQKIPMR